VGFFFFNSAFQGSTFSCRIFLTVWHFLSVFFTSASLSLWPSNAQVPQRSVLDCLFFSIYSHFWMISTYFMVEFDLDFLLELQIIWPTHYLHLDTQEEPGQQPHIKPLISTLPSVLTMCPFSGIGRIYLSAILFSAYIQAIRNFYLFYKYMQHLIFSQKSPLHSSHQNYLPEGYALLSFNESSIVATRIICV
jgi:hypothetical protein